jgi:hypothetical protein
LRVAPSIVLVTTLALFAAAEPELTTFHDKLDAYVKLRKKATEKVPPLKKSATPVEIQQREQALAEAIRNARPNAKAGDIFTPESKPVFNTLLKGALKGPENQETRASIKEGNPKHEKAPGEVSPVIQVNAVYPKNAPLSTVPPTLLLTLPKLPKDIEYRFVGRTLVLRDRESNLIIDYMKEAAPAG